MNRAELVMDYMREFGSITTLDAFRDLGCTRLACAISEIKKNGYNVHKKYETKKNRRGIPVTYARYFLGEKNAN